MMCPSCNKEIAPESFFCIWCSDFVPAPTLGTKANLFARWIALAIDPLIAFVLYFIGVGIFGSMSQDLGVAAVIILPFVYFVWFLSLFKNGQTPGKKLLGLRVVNYQTGAMPGFARMFLREIVGRFLSGLFLGLGYFWAIFDKNSQTWHDKLAGTAVIKLTQRRASDESRLPSILMPGEHSHGSSNGQARRGFVESKPLRCQECGAVQERSEIACCKECGASID